LFALPLRNMLVLLNNAAYRKSRSLLNVALSCYVLLFIASSVHPFLYNLYLYVTLFVFAGFAAHLRRSTMPDCTGAVAGT